MDDRQRQINHLQKQIERLQAGEELEDDPVLDRLKVRKRPYTVSPAVLERNRQNAQHSTGPVTEEGKAASSRNAWKHGQNARRRALLFGKPCKSTCPKFPCSLVDEGEVSPGADCLDKEHFIHNLKAFEEAVYDGKLDGLKDLAGATLAGTVSIIQELQYSVLTDGVYMKSEKIDKDGNIIGYELKPNPSLLPLGNLLKAAGLTLPDFMLTPREVQKVKDDDENRKTVADFFRGAAGALAAARDRKDG